jgi:hypothetical protein
MTPTAYKYALAVLLIFSSAFTLFLFLTTPTGHTPIDLSALLDATVHAKEGRFQLDCKP